MPATSGSPSTRSFRPPALLPRRQPDTSRLNFDPALTEQATHPGLRQGKRQAARPPLGLLALSRRGRPRQVERGVALRCIEPLEFRRYGIEHLALAQHPERI